jgi:NADH dehydrogenase
VAHLVFVSSIAATYADQRFYPYAHSKSGAEAGVRGGVVPWTILRPTLVFGRGSPGQLAFERLALLPRPVVFGTGRHATEPVHVEDVARVIVRAAMERWAGETVDVGGPDTLSIDGLIALIRKLRGRSAAAPLHVPLAPLRLALAMAEPLLRPLLPFTAGQLAVFANPSCAAPHPRTAPLRATMKSAHEMLLAA